MNVYFSGIGGTAIGPLALIAKQAGYTVSGSDKQDSDYISYLRQQGIENISIGQTGAELEATHSKTPIKWLVYSSALVKENPVHPEIVMAKKLGIKTSKRDEFLNKLLDDTGQKMFAVAGTHGKTTTTAMLVWLLKELNIPISYSVGAKLSFGEMGEFNPEANYFVYEADEYDRNFLSFNPAISVITGIAYDHPDIYPTIENYNNAFKQFFTQSNQVRLWGWDYKKLGIQSGEFSNLKVEAELTNLESINLPGEVNRQNAHLAISALATLGYCTYEEGVRIINKFPGVSRRFEKIANNIYSDYAHTPEKIAGALQLAKEVAGNNVVVVYEGLHNTRQHFIQKELESLFAGVKVLYIVPSYLAREDKSLEMLDPKKLSETVKQPIDRHPAELDENLQNTILKHVNDGNLVLCLSAGGGGSLDEWLRATF